MGFGRTVAASPSKSVAIKPKLTPSRWRVTTHGFGTAQLIFIASLSSAPAAPLGQRTNCILFAASAQRLSRFPKFNRRKTGPGAIIEKLRMLFSGSKRIKAEDLIKIFALPPGEDLK
jgi:hypothetical protein